MTYENNNLEFDQFKATLDEHAPIKKRHVRTNQTLFMNTKINKVMMKRSGLRKQFFKHKIWHW